MRIVSTALFLALALAGPVAGPALSQSLPAAPRVAPAADEGIEALFAVLQVDAIIAVMREEGLSYGRTLEADLFPGAGGAAWAAKVDAVYDSQKMVSVFKDRLQRELQGADLTGMLGFFGSKAGLRVTALELSARRALLDDGVTETADQIRDEMLRTGGPRLESLRQFIEVNDLIEANVASALNANYAFYTGLVDGGAFGFDLSEQEIVADVWSQEDSIRFETEQWLLSYLGMAYQPLSNAEFAAYIDFSATPESQLLNRALFAAFDELFGTVSRELGLGAAGHMAGQEL